ncbi:hypothetical protein HMPREF3034_00026 [Prevotella sp. DNF00663]|uniref:hypothetical protein n=1 Tax=Prevotella sp. DNF00663 TaxID=1384078 RepID=UPI0007809DE1|nr:hypothetical protein [Prevotella sp. DNF00663]KXB86078.1 hypothetical protein HMPREF3034_00026 [Prevotella sp. DNF00663]
MIHCLLNGNTAYPDTSSNIKVTYSNPYVEDSGSYTYTIAFPMAIMSNRAIFGNVDRQETRKRIPDFSDCKLYIDNRLIICGKGTVIGIASGQVKLQIVGGKSRIKYNSRFASHYIDAIDYGVKRKKGIQGHFGNNPNATYIHDFIKTDLSKSSLIGEPGIYAYCPIYDETHERFHNVPFVKDNRSQGIESTAAQPFLLFVVEKALAAEGFTLIRNDFNKEPWNMLLIASCRLGLDIAGSLPHWSVYTFLDEVRKLLNATLIFNEPNKTVQLVSGSEMLSEGYVEYECDDDFNCEYDKDGLSNLATSNIQYSFATSSKRDWREVVSADIQKAFTMKEYDTPAAAETAGKAMSTKERRTTLFKANGKTYIYAMLEHSPESATLVEKFTQVGFFSPLIRDAESDNFIDLKISPVAMASIKLFPDDDKIREFGSDIPRDIELCVPSISVDSTNKNSNSADESGEIFVSVQDAMDGSSIKAEEDTEAIMPVMFLSKKAYNTYMKRAVAIKDTADEDSKAYRFPFAYTDQNMFPEFTASGTEADHGSFSLIDKESGIGKFFMEKMSIDKNDLMTIKFITDDIPDPSKIYVFRNKRYICQKVELDIKNGSIERLKTGYFYQMN